MKDFEIGPLRQALEQNQFNQNKVVKTLSLGYRELSVFLRKYDLLG